MIIVDLNSPLTTTCLAVITLGAVVGLLLNLFMVFVFLQNVQREKGSYSGDAIRAAMIIASMVLTLMLMFSLICYIFFPKVYSDFRILFDAFTIYSISSNLYLTSIYCFFLFMKIVQFKSDPLIWVKRNIAVVIPRLMVVEEVFSFCCSFLSFCFFYGNEKVYTNSSTIPTVHGIKGKNLGQHMPFLISAIFLVPYFFMSLPILLATSFLILHSHKMRAVGSVSIELYKCTIFKMLRLFSYNTLLSLVLCLLYFSDLIDHISVFWTLLIILLLLPPARSVVLIYSNPKMRNAWTKMIAYIFYR